MKQVLVTGSGYTDEQFDSIRKCGFEIHHFVEIDDADLTSQIEKVHGYILGGSEHLNSQLLRKANKLKIISFVGTNYEAFIDAKFAKNNGVIIENTPNLNTNAVAEHTIGLLIGAVRGLFSQNEFSKRSGTFEVTSELKDLKIGIIGLGNIGSRIAEILVRGFECEVIYFSRTRKLEIEKSLGIKYMGFDKVLLNSNVLILMIPSNNETRNLFDTESFALVKKGSILINTASASLVEPVALFSAIKSGTISVAAFDGYWTEPLPDPTDDSYNFLNLPDHQFIITPHSAAKTKGTWNRMIQMAVENFINMCEAK